MKKVLIIALTFIMMFAVSACSLFNNTNNNNSSTEDDAWTNFY